MSRKGKFSMVSRSIWKSARFNALESHRDKLAYFYYLTCSHMTATGCYSLPDGYAIADLGWPLDEYVAAREALQKAGMIDRDPETHEIYVEKWLTNNPPSNPKHATGITTMIYDIESDRLREKVEADFSEVYRRNPLDNHPSQRGGGGLTDTAYFRGGRS